MRKDSLGKLIDRSKNPAQSFSDKKLSKLGDALLNFIYSLNLSMSQGVATGAKIPNRILAKAIESSRHKNLIPRRSDKHRKGDLVEAIFAYAWLEGRLDINESIKFIDVGMDAGRETLDPENYARALGQLMDKILDEMGIPEDAS